MAKNGERLNRFDPRPRKKLSIESLGKMTGTAGPGKTGGVAVDTVEVHKTNTTVSLGYAID